MKSKVRRFFTDKNNHVAVFQPPNLPLITWFILTVLSHFLTSGQTKNWVEAAAFISLVIWALLEIFRGASYFRRLLGLVILGLSLYSKLS